MMKTLKISALLIAISLVASYSCKKKKADPHIPPDVVFKTGGNYTSGNRALHKKDTIYVGVIATKTEDDLKSYNVSFIYDSGTSGTTYFNYLMSDTEKESYSHDIQIPVRDIAGVEKWIFTVVDRDGNITQKTIVLTVS